MNIFESIQNGPRCIQESTFFLVTKLHARAHCFNMRANAKLDVRVNVYDNL